MDSEDSGPRRFVNFVFVLLLMLVQLDILDYAASGDQAETVRKVSYAVDNEKEGADEPREAYYYKIRPVFPAPRLFFSMIPEMVPLRLGASLISEILLYFSLNNRYTHIVCCVYLI